MTCQSHSAEVATAEVSFYLVKPNSVPDRKVPLQALLSIKKFFMFDGCLGRNSPFPRFVIFKVPDKLGVEPPLVACLPWHPAAG